jgi:signal transduction histidine kinase
MTPTLPNVLVALLWAAGACALMWLITLPLRRRSLGALLASVVLTGTAASVGAIFGFVQAMLLPANQQVTVIVVVSAAGVVGAVGAAAASRRLTKDRQVLRSAVAELGQGLVPAHDGRRLTSELEQVRHELRLTAQGLAESRARERSLESARRELVSWVSHDLRTPLAGLRAISEALEDGVVDEPELYYKQIRTAVDRLSGMVDDLFDLSRIQAGSFSRDVGAIPLDDLVSDCVAALEPLAAAQGVRLVGRTAGSATVAGSAPELNRALTNLVANAIRHTPTDGRVDVLVGQRADDSAPVAEVVVEDQCGGIADDDLARVFDVGFRGEPARTPHAVHPAGAGLGLAITRGIVEAHAGTVHVENTADGCRFTVWLPVAV